MCRNRYSRLESKGVEKQAEKVVGSASSGPAPTVSVSPFSPTGCPLLALLLVATDDANADANTGASADANADASADANADSSANNQPSPYFRVAVAVSVASSPSPSSDDDADTGDAASLVVSPPPPLHDLTEPVTLPCGHNFNLDALKERMRLGAGDCSVCGATLHVPEQFSVKCEVKRMLAHFLAAKGQCKVAAASPRSGKKKAATPETSTTPADKPAGKPADKPAGERPKFRVSSSIGRDTHGVTEMMATRFAATLASVTSRSSCWEGVRATRLKTCERTNL